MMRVRATSFEKRQRRARFSREAEVLAKRPPPKRRVAWKGGKITHNKDQALWAYLERLRREGRQLTETQQQAQ